MNHEAIRHAYPNAVTIDDTLGAFDSEGNQIELDMTLVDAASIEVDAENMLKGLRHKRNRLLTETDWTQSRDVTLPNDSEWAAHRQALRVLPANTDDPANPVWPTKPS